MATTNETMKLNKADAKTAANLPKGWTLMPADRIEVDRVRFTREVDFGMTDGTGRKLGCDLFVTKDSRTGNMWNARLHSTRDRKTFGAWTYGTEHATLAEAIQAAEGKVAASRSRQAKLNGGGDVLAKTAAGAKAIAAEKRTAKLAAVAKAAAETKVSRGPSRAVVKAAAAKLKAELESPEMAAAFKAPIPKARGTRKAPAATVSARKSAKGPAAPAAPEQLDMLTAIYPKGIAVTEYPKLLKALVDVMKPAQPAKAVFTVKEISELIGVTRATVQVWIGEKKLTGKRDGWKFLVPRASLEKFLASTGRSKALAKMQ